MSTFTINTKDLGAITFFVARDGGYVFADLNGQSGTLGRQICSGGSTMGSTLTSSIAGLPQVARTWNRQRRARLLRTGF